MTEQWIGRTLSKVEILERIGGGGMAEVYRGVHTTLNRSVAVKILHGHLTRESELLRRTHDEAQAVAGLRHPNIVQVYDFDVVDGRPYIVMELLEGMSLYDYLQGLHDTGLTLPLDRVTILISSLAGALDYAHARGVVHRDIKPANVMLRQGATPIREGFPLPRDVIPILTDFGVARWTQASKQTATGTILGTPSYMSPEQVQGTRVDSRSDIYSLGILLYEMLSGTLPFDPDKDTPATILYKHVHVTPPPLPNAPEPLQEITERALAKKPEDRFQKAGDLAAALQEATGERVDTTVVASTQAAESRAAAADSLLGSRTLRLAGGIIAGGLILILAGWFALQSLFGGSGAGDQPPAPQATATQAAAQVLAAPSATIPAASPTLLPPPTPTELSLQGAAFLRPARFSATLTGLEAPGEGFAYHGWLQKADGELLPLGIAAWSEGRVRLTYNAAEANLNDYPIFLLSYGLVGDEEPPAEDAVILHGRLGEETLSRLQLLTEVTGSPDPIEALLTGAVNQAGHYDSHRNFAINSVDSDDLGGAKSHSEHVLNIVEGRTGELYGDWNGNDLVENPGDDVGLLVYLRLLESYLAGAERLAADEASRTAAVEASDNLNQIIEVVLEARATVRQIALADTIEIVHEVGLADELTELGLTEDVEALVASIESLDLALDLEISPGLP